MGPSQYRLSFFVGLAILGAVLGGSVALAVSHHSTPSTLGRTSLTMDQPPHTACGQNQTPLGMIAYLKPGQTPAAVSAQGLTAQPLKALQAMPPTVLFAPPEVQRLGTAPPQLVGPLPATAAAYGLVYPQASEVALVSCDYQLVDKPADKVYVASAEAILLSNGMVTQNQLDTDPIFFVSDDPLDQHVYIVTVKVLGEPIVPPPNTPQGVRILSTHSYAVIEDTQSAVVAAFGEAPW